MNPTQFFEEAGEKKRVLLNDSSVEVNMPISCE